MTRETPKLSLFAKAIERAIARYKSDYERGVKDGEAGEILKIIHNPAVDRAPYEVGYASGLRERQKREKKSMK